MLARAGVDRVSTSSVNKVDRAVATSARLSCPASIKTGRLSPSSSSDRLTTYGAATPKLERVSVSSKEPANPASISNFDDDSLWHLLSEMQLEKTESLPLEEECVPSPLACVNEACTCVDFQQDDMDVICMTCGTVQYKNIDYGAEWRYYGFNDNKSSNPTRCGMPTNEFLPKSSLGTVIGTERMTKNFYEMARIRKYHMWNSMPYKERSLYNVINRLNTKATNGGISSSIIEDAKVMYKKLSEMKISRGENRNGLIASSIYMSCKNNGVPRSAKEIASIFNLNITTMTKGCKKFHEIMRLNVASTSPDDFIVRFCSKLDRPDIVEDSLYIVRAADKYSIVSENAPPSIAAGSIYLCSMVRNHGVTKKEISKACEISEVTINKCYKKLVMYVSYLLPVDAQKSSSN